MDCASFMEGRWPPSVLPAMEDTLSPVCAGLRAIFITPIDAGIPAVLD